MARITVEDCLRQVNNRFALIHLAAKRVRQLRKGIEPTLVSKNRDIVVALREIAAGNVIQAEPREDTEDDLLEIQEETVTEESEEKAEEDTPDAEPVEEPTSEGS